MMLNDLLDWLCDINGPRYVIKQLLDLGYTEQDLLDVGFAIDDIDAVRRQDV